MQLDSQVSFSESELILACLRVRYGSGCHADMQDRLRHGLNWHEILSTAQRHGIVPLLYEALSSNLSRLPADVRNGLRRNFQQNAANSFLYASELVRVTDCLRREPIAALAFKGPTLTAQLYGKLSLRTIRDLDILVGQQQMDSALKVLQRCGYSPVPGSGGRFSLSSKLQKHVLLAHQSLGFRIELHWAISERSFAFGLSFDQLWAARRDVAILGAPVATVGPEDLLLILSAHGTNHCWGSLKWICDIAEAIRAFPDLDWDHLVARAGRLGCRRMLLTGMTIANDVCSIDLPGPVERARALYKPAGLMSRQIPSGLLTSGQPPVDLERTLTFVRSRERLRDRLRILTMFLTPKLRPGPRERALIHLPDSLAALYIPLRLLRLLVVYWQRAIVPILQSAAGQMRFRDRPAMLPPE
ncbi:MAG TPA: nucleotidyltransferase family protein [Bryobacteraceae bacterium]|nr:nucleotidyltransferase family protein [Bryobacteraceae bacterium]